MTDEFGGVPQDFDVGPASLRYYALLVREGRDRPECAGLSVGPGFVVGCGIDFAEVYRGLRDIWVVSPTQP